MMRGSKTSRQFGVILNYASLFLIIWIVYWVELQGAEPLTMVGLAALLILMVISFILIHISTGLWKLTHTRVSNLDERQVQVTHDALRNSYAIITILCLMALLWKAAFPGENPNLIVIFAALLYLAHTLPASVIAWREREV